MNRILLTALLLASAGCVEMRHDYGRMAPSKLNIGVYCLSTNAQTEAHVKDIADCGVDFVESVGYDLKLMDLFAKYGLGAIVTKVAPPWWGGNGDRAGKMAEVCPLSLYEEAAAKFVDHPAIWGIDIGDEPSALDFPHYGKVAKRVRELFPNQFPYLNLYPNYASVAKNNGEETVNQLGTATYDEHIAAYVKNVDLPYICYDFYVYSINVEKMHENFRSVTDACRRSGRDFWYVLQVNSNDPKKILSANQLRYQAHIALAYGAQTLLWACWTKGWWHHNVLDEQGNRTEQYEKLKTVNAELHALGKTYMQFRTIATHRVTDKPLEAAGLKSVRALDGAELMIGEMAGRADGRRALFIAASDDPHDTDGKDHVITLSAGTEKVSVIGAGGAIPLARNADGACTLTLRSNAAALVIADGR